MKNTDRLAKLVSALQDIDRRRDEIVAEMHQLTGEMLPPATAPKAAKTPRKKSQSQGKTNGRKAAIRTLMDDGMARTCADIHTVISGQGVPGAPDRTRHELRQFVNAGQFRVIGEGTDRQYQKISQ